MITRLPGRVDPRLTLSASYGVNSPDGIPDLELWCEVGLETGYSDMDTITTLVDQSGNGWNLGSGSATYFAGSGFPYVQRVGGAGTHFRNMSFPAFGNNPFTLVVACEHTTNTDRIPAALGGSSSCHRNWGPARTQVWLWCDDPLYSTAIAAETPVVIVSRVQNGSQIITTPGTTHYTGSFIDFNIFPGVTACGWFNGDRQFDGKYYGHCVYSRILNTSEIDILTTYWTDRMP